MRYQAWSDTARSQHINTRATARILLEPVRATETTSRRHTQKQQQQQQHGSRIASKTHNDINTERAELLVLYSQNIRWSLWVSGTTCASHPSSLESSSGRYLKASEARYALHSCSPLLQLVTSCRFPAPWVDSSFVNSERASQPASDVSCERWTTFSLALPLSPSRSASTLLPSLSLYLTVLFLSPSLPPFLLLSHHTAQ